MIENLRKYTGLIIVAVALVFVGLVFLADTGLTNRSAGGGTYVTVDGRGYSQTDVTKLGSSAMQLATARELGAYELMGFAYGLLGGASQEGAPVQFFASRMILRDAREQFGVHPSDQEVQDYVRGMSAFQTPPAVPSPGATGEFDQQRYNKFIHDVLGGFGMVERDFHELIRDMLATDKLREIIGGGLSIDRELAEAMLVLNAQQVAVGVAPLDLNAIREGIQPDDETLKTYWETIKEAYQTEQRIKVSYLLIGPDYPEEEPPAEEADETDETDEEDSEDSDEATDEEEKAAEEEEKAERRTQAEREFKIAVDEFLTRLREQEGANLESLLEPHGWTLASTDWFTATTLPEALEPLKTRGTSARRQVADYLFALRTGPDPLAPFTSAIAVGEDQYLIARLDELEEAREKTFEEARETVLERYVDEKTREAAEQKVEETTAALKASIEAGKSFSEAATEAGLEPRELGPFAVSDSLDDEPNARQIFQAAAIANPGEFAEPIYLEDKVLLVRVESRQIIKDDNRGQQVDSYGNRYRDNHRNDAFAAWLAQRVAEAQVTVAGGR